MQKKTVLVAVFVILSFGHIPPAGAEKTYSRESVKQFVLNAASHFLIRDGETSLFALTQMRAGDNEPALELFEYQLDLIVCDTWDNLDKMEGWQRERAMQLLRQIKFYRQVHPRDSRILLDGYDVGEAFSPVKFSAIERAQKILDDL